MRLFFILFFILFTTLPIQAKHLYPEKYYQNQWCSKWHGISEAKLIDGTRVDCLTKNYATEFDFAPKWAESIGQSLHYARLTGKKPAIVLIIENPSDFKYYNKIKPLCEQYSIALWYMKAPQYSSEIRCDFDINQDLFALVYKYVKDFLYSLI